MDCLRTLRTLSLVFRVLKLSPQNLPFFLPPPPPPFPPLAQPRYNPRDDGSVFLPNVSPDHSYKPSLPRRCLVGQRLPRRQLCAATSPFGVYSPKSKVVGLNVNSHKGKFKLPRLPQEQATFGTRIDGKNYCFITTITIISSSWHSCAHRRAATEEEGHQGPAAAAAAAAAAAKYIYKREGGQGGGLWRVGRRRRSNL